MASSPDKRTYESEGILGALQSQGEEAKLQELGFLFNAVTEQIGVGYWDWYIPDNYEYLSPRFKEMFGYKDHEMPNSPESWQKIIHPDDLPAVLECFDAHVATKGKSPYKSEVRYFHKEGHIIWVLCQGKVIEWDGEGKPIRMIGTHIDITAQKKTEQALRKSNQIFQKMEAAAQIGSWELVLDEPPVLYWSDETYEIHEVPEDFVPDVDSGLAFYKEEHRPIIIKAIEEAVDHGTPFDHKLMIKTMKGNTKWVRTLGQAEMSGDTDSRAARVWGVFQDITSDMEQEVKLLKAKEEAEQAAKAKEEFLSTMSHEIRTPLNSVIGMSYMLLQDHPREDQYEKLRILKFSAENLLSLINDILDFNKIETGELKLEETAFDLAHLLKSICAGLDFKAKEKRISLKRMVDSSLPSKVVGDPTRLTQILTNLLSNAIKFTQEGYVKVEVELLSEEAEQLNLLISVKDTGIGIPKEKQATIFQRFSQAEKSTTRNFGGTGLGLAIVKRLLEIMGSKIKVESTEGQGSTFCFEITLGKALEPHAPKALAKEYHGSEKLKEDDFDLDGAQILVAEDNPLNQVVVGEFLKKWNAQVEYAKDGAEAFEKMASKVFDLVLMDLQMPVMGGIESVQKLVKEHPEQLSKFNIIALTATESTTVYQQVTEAGMADYATKPFNPKELYAKIVKYLPQKRTANAHKAKATLTFGSKQIELEHHYFQALSLKKLGKVAEFGEELALQFLKSTEQYLHSYMAEFEQSLGNNHFEKLDDLVGNVISALQKIGTETVLECAQHTKTALRQVNDKTPEKVAELTNHCKKDVEKFLEEISLLQKAIAKAE